MRLIRALGGLATASASMRCLSILIFHRVLERPDPLFPEEPDVERFDQILGWIGRAFNVVALERGIAALGDGPLPPRAVAITFDDGYADNQTLAVPLLQRHGLHATFFVASGFLDGGCMWNDIVIEAVRGTRSAVLDLQDADLGHHELTDHRARRRAIDLLLPAVKHRSPGERAQLVALIASRCGVGIPRDLMMTTGQVRALHRSGMSVGGHTVNHPILASVDDGEAWREIVENKKRLEEMLDAPLTMFAYPNGKPDSDYRAVHAEMVRRAGYAAAVTTAPGVSRPGADRWQLPRFTPWDRRGFRFGLRMLRNMYEPGRLAA